MPLIFLLGSDPTPSGAIVSYKEVEVVWTLVVLVSIYSDRLFFSSIMKRLLSAGCIVSALTDWLQTRVIPSTCKGTGQNNRLYSNKTHL